MRAQTVSLLQRMRELLVSAPAKQGERQSAIAYRRGAQVYLHASSKTTAGVWVLQAPVLVADASDPVSLGRNLATVLGASLEGVPHPASFDGIFDPILRAASVASWAAFTDGVLCVGITAEHGHVTFVPTRNRGGQGGFAYLKDKQRGLDATAAVDFGAALMLTYAQCS